jgi:sugar lactone lactonase YvrE
MKAICVRISFVIVAMLVGNLANAQHPSNGPHIFVTDSSSAVLRTETGTGKLSLVSRGQSLRQPFGIAVGNDGELFVSDTGSAAIFAIDPVTGGQNVVSTRGLLGLPFGIAVERDGNLLAANGNYLLRINPTTHSQQIIASDGWFGSPLAVAVKPNGDILVLDAIRRVIQVDAQSGEQALISEGGFLRNPQGIATKGNSIYITDVSTPGGNFGVGCVIEIDAHNGNQAVLSSGGFLVGPVGVAIEDNGQILVGDPYTINNNSPDLYDGGVIRIDPQSGMQTLLARGQGEFVNPRCIAVVSTRGND